MRYLYIDSCTIKKDIWNLSKPHRYEIAKIELLEAPSRSDREPLAMTSNNSISAAKLLKNVEKSYDNGKFIVKIRFHNRILHASATTNAIVRR